ncbi:MAG TPA: hypothetical protein VNT60_05935 [Deinococcales bacterium]|nr:hypothetical protein [Deinococcales bacterium]
MKKVLLVSAISVVALAACGTTLVNLGDREIPLVASGSSVSVTTNANGAVAAQSLGAGAQVATDSSIPGFGQVTGVSSASVSANVTVGGNVGLQNIVATPSLTGTLTMKNAAIRVVFYKAGETKTCADGYEVASGINLTGNINNNSATVTGTVASTSGIRQAANDYLTAARSSGTPATFVTGCVSAGEVSFKATGSSTEQKVVNATISFSDLRLLAKGLGAGL